jgi:hypothetical protein
MLSSTQNPASMKGRIVVACLLFTLVALSSATISVEPTSSVKYQVNNDFPIHLSIEELELALNISHSQLTPAAAHHDNINNPIKVAPIDPSSLFTVEIGRRYWAYAKVSYAGSNEQILQWSCGGWCAVPEVSAFHCSHVISDSATQTLAYVGYSTENEEIIVAFRGTNNLVNWVNDLKFLKTDQALDGIPNALTARGFYKCYLALRNGVYNAVLANIKLNPSFTIKVIGHSLGGAISSITTLDLTFNAKLSPQSYTFGSPRAGDHGFASAYESYVAAFWRLTHDDDPVPHLPFQKLGFYHIPHEIYEHDETKQYIMCTVKNGEDPACSDSQGLHLSIADHLSYMQAKNPWTQQQALAPLQSTNVPANSLQLLKLRLGILRHQTFN